MSANTPTRRGLFAGGAALAAASAMPAADAASPDAALLAACARFVRAEAQYRRLNDAECAIENAEADLTAPSAALTAASAALQAHSSGEYDDARDAFMEAPEPTTPEGLRAVAEAVWCFYTPDPPDRDGMGSMIWTVVCAAAGKPYEAGA